MHRIVIAGAGLGGLRSAMALREHGYAGRVTLVGQESAQPYDRPPLSKELLLDPDPHAVDPTLPADWEALDVELLLSRTVTGIGSGVVETDGGNVPCDGVVLATGALPLTLPAVPQAVSLHTLADARRIRAAFRPGGRILVIGAGWIGAELATAAARAGCAVTVAESGEVPLGQALPAEVGKVTIPWWDKAGVDLRTGCRITGADGQDGTPTTVHFADGGTVVADLVVAGVGVRPATDWLIGSGIALDPAGAVLTDEALRTNVSGVVAVGDIAAWQSRRYGRRLHVQHWDTALHGPVVATENLLRSPDPGSIPEAVYDPVPYFWSMQFGHNLQLVGYPPAGSEIVWRGDPTADQAWSVGWFDGERLVAVLAVDHPRDVRQAKRLLESGAAVDPARFADPSIAVKDTAVPGQAAPAPEPGEPKSEGEGGRSRRGRNTSARGKRAAPGGNEPAGPVTAEAGAGRTTMSFGGRTTPGKGWGDSGTLVAGSAS